MSDCCSSKENSNSCCGEATGPRLVFACSGGANVGQIANSAAMELDKRKKGRMYCLVGVAAHIGGMVNSAKSASGIIAIDGCQTACAKAALEHLHLPNFQHVVVTDLGIEKNHRYEWTNEQVEVVVNVVINS